MKIHLYQLLDLGIADMYSHKKCGFTQSRGEGKRLIQQGGVSIDNENVNAIDKTYTQADFANGLVVKKGKKNFRKVLLSD